MGGTTNLVKSLIIAVLVLAVVVVNIEGKLIYVDTDANGFNDGSSWENAYNYLQDALTDADSNIKPVEIRVARGIYKPDMDEAGNVTPGDREATFQLENGVVIRGGYAGYNESEPNVWDIRLYETILSGDLLGNDVGGLYDPSRDENAYHVVTGNVSDPNAALDGFTITGGNANGPDPFINDSGGGMYNYNGSPTITNCTFSDNAAWFLGGGMHNVNNSDPIVTNCTFRGNTAELFGGGMLNADNSDPIVTNCTFRGNSVETDGGGGMSNMFSSSPRVTNCAFSGNSGSNGGGAIDNFRRCNPTVVNCIFSGNSSLYGGGICTLEDSSLRITNCTFVGNSALTCGGAIYDANATTTVNNCVFWANVGLWDRTALIQGTHIALVNGSSASLSYCTIQGGQTNLYVDTSSTLNWGAGNIDLDPNLTPDGHLHSGSACVNLGDPNFIPDPNALTDIDSDDRIMDGRVEIGADEFLDSDGDGLPNWWEQVYFGDPNSTDPCDDPDTDELSNLEEYEIYSSGPNEPPYYVDAIDGNDDYDGLAPMPQGGSVGPKKTIQGGIDAAGNGDTVLVAAGIYTGAGNYELDYAGKSIIVLAPNRATIDCNFSGRAIESVGIQWWTKKSIFGVLDGFTIENGLADVGGAIHIENFQFMYKDCVLSGNSATEKAGGLYTRATNPTFNNLIIQANTSPNEPNGALIEFSCVNLQGDLTLEAGRLDVYSSWFYGPGQIYLAKGATLKVTTNPNNPTGPTVIRCNISGPGIIQVDLGSELIIEGDAIINLAHETDPNLNGKIQCNGLLLVRDSVHLSNANVQVNRASFEGDVDISNSIITAEAGAPYGQFFIEDSVQIAGNEIHADGDRYLDLNPSVFAGVIANNRIFVTITEGVGNTRGGLLELRGSDGLVSGSSCDPNNEFFCEVNDVPVFDTNSWMIEQLELWPGAKVNLTNRFDFGNGGIYEVMYVKDLILGPNSVLNTSFNQLYYQNLVGDLNSVRNEPLLGFSLSNIALDNNNEFFTRVMHNNYIDPDPSPPDYTRIHVERVDGNAPDPNGMMRMCNLKDKDPMSSTYGKLFLARAKGLFAKASEDEILIRFEYLFGSSDPNVKLVIYLSDVPELLAHNDPCRLDHYIEAARLYPPPPGQYGSAGSDHLGVFEKVVSAGNLNFIRGVRMELELVGPDGTCILINNWDPYVSCIYCGDVTGDYGVTPRDYLTVLGESGELSSGLNGLGLPLDCLEDFGFSEDGFLDATDLMGWDWGEWLVSEGSVGDLCFGLFLTPDFNESAGSEVLLYDVTSTIAPEAGGVTGYTGSLLIGGKRFDAVYEDFLSDRLYEFDESYNLVGGPYALPTDRVNGKLVRDHNDLLYQINVEEGLVRFSDLSSVIPRGQAYSVISEPRYEQSGTVYVGFQDQGEDTWGRPILDAAFDSQGNVYVTPVVVVPDVYEAYIASAKLVLAPGQVPPYQVVTIFDDPPLPNNNQDCNNLSEIEVDDYGNVYVINSGYTNGSDILWFYDSNGVVRKCGLQSLGIYGPVGLCCSGYDNSLIYVASSKGEPDAGSAALYALSTVDFSLVQTITINNMGHITDITEDPNTGTVWVTGFTMPEYMSYLPSALANIPQFYHPYLAAVPYGSSSPVQATQLSNAADLALPLSIAWVGHIPEKCGGADLDGLGDIGFGDLDILTSQWLQHPGTPSADIAPKPNGDGIVNFMDLAVLAGHWKETCGP